MSSDFRTGEEEAGLWWLPGEEDNRVPGILRSLEGAPQLRVHGWLGPRFDWSNRVPLPPSYPAILGETQHNVYTLWNSVLTRYTDPRWPQRPLSSQLRDQTFEASRLLLGEHRPDPAEAFVRSLSVKFAHLNDFSLGFAKSTDDDFTYYTKRARLAGARVLFFGGTASNQSLEEIVKSTFHTIEVHAHEAASLRDFEFRWLRPLQSFISIAVDEHARLMEQRILYTEAEPGHRSTSIFTHGVDQEPPDRRQHTWDMVMSLMDGRLESRLRKWFELDGSASHALTNLSMLRSPHAGFLSNRLMNAATGLEGIQRALGPELKNDPSELRRRRHIGRNLNPGDREWFFRATEWAGQPSFEDRMKILADSVPKVSAWLLGSVDDWSHRLRLERHGNAHALQEPFLSRPDAEYLVALIEVSRAIGIARLMVELKYSQREILKRFTASPSIGFQRDRWHKVVATRLGASE